METVNLASNAAAQHPFITSGTNAPDGLLKQLSYYQQEKSILLALSNDITKVREKDDLITLFSTRLKGLFYFTHTIVMLIDQQNKTYSPFLLDLASSPIKDYPDYPELIKKNFVLDAPFIHQVLDADEPIIFQLEDLLFLSELPSFIRINYERGNREMIITPLKSKMKTIGFTLVFSDKADSFTSGFKSILQGIAPQLSNAVSNIIINEEINRNEWVNKILLSVSNEMVTVRSRMDLLKVINSGLTKLIDFTHSVMTVLNENGETYKAFLTDPNSKPKGFAKYTEAISIPYPVHDGIYNIAVASEKPLVFDIRSLDMNKAPLWLKLNYIAGAREMLIKVLPEDGSPKHSLILFADHLKIFNDESLHIVDRISSQLATAAKNIAANEEIENKEKDKSFLLELSNNIAAVRTKDDLELVIYQALKQLSNIQLYVIRKLEEDGIGLSLFMLDKDRFYRDDPIYKELTHTIYSAREGVSAQVMRGNTPLIFDVEKEVAKGNTEPIVQLWKNNGFKRTYGAPLRVGDKALGILWLVTDEINMSLLKGICDQVSTAMSNIIANEKVQAYKQQLEIENDHLKEQIKTIYNFSEIIGSGPEMEKVYSLMSRVAESNATVLILGETGTGKELIARAIHNASPRKSKLMVKINCAALPANLIESELFGHEKGSFTGAFDRRIGKFEMAHNSTLFLDEIGEMPLELQVKLLRVIQERELERVGGKTTIKVDVRIIAATNRNLEEEVNHGKFRPDLYYRLNVFPINLPPLRERTEDIAPLTEFFLTRYSKLTGIKITGITPKVLQQLQSYMWPGNVRELEHVIERSILLTNDSILRDITLPKSRDDHKNMLDNLSNCTLEVLERKHIIEVLKRCKGKIAGVGGAAELLDIPSTTLHSKMKKLNISKEDYFIK